LDSTTMGDTDEFRYTTLHLPGQADQPLVGVMDASGFLPDGAPSHWVTYWEVEDIDAAYARVGAMGGTQLEEPVDTPYGRMATAADPAGAQFKLRTGPC
jgi:uncharacterized protein